MKVYENFCDVEIMPLGISTYKLKAISFKLQALIFKLIIMTDPVQTTDPQQQAGQQSHTDDILGWDDIFNTIPKAESEDDLPYGDVLEKKYQYEPIPEPKETAVAQPEQAVEKNPVVEKVTQETPVVEKAGVTEEKKEGDDQKVAPVINAVVEREVQEINQQARVEQEKVWTLLDTKLQTDVQKKFGELFFTTKRIYAIKEKLWQKEDTFDVLWADNDKLFVSYRFVLDETNDPTLVITKIEQDKTTEEETTNELRFMFNQEVSSLEVMVNDTLLFDEIQDFTEDQKKKMQVSEKLNKFLFLASEEQRKWEKEIQIKEEEEREKRKLQDIFRNF